MRPSSSVDPGVGAEPWRILRWRSRHQTYPEQLAPGVALTMLRSPAGHFQLSEPARAFVHRWGSWKQMLKADARGSSSNTPGTL